MSRSPCRSTLPPLALSLSDLFRSSLRVPRWWPVLTGVTLLLAASAWVRLGGWDEAVFRVFNALGAFAPPLWASLSVIGLGLSVFILWLAACPGALHERMQAVAALIWCFPIGGLLTHGFKQLFSTPRPPAVLPLDQIQVIGVPLLHHSLPSGHALTAMAAAWLWLHVHRSTVGAKALAVVFVAGVVLARMATAAHWPSDVLAGMGAGCLAAQISLALTDRWSLARWLSGTVGQWVLAIVQIACGVAMALENTGYPSAQPVQGVLAALGVGSGLWRLFQWRARARLMRGAAGR